MIQAFSAYIKNIAVYLIFMSFISIIIPQKKYKEYINLTMSLILIFIVIAPLSGFLDQFSHSSGDLFADVSIQYDKSVMQKDNAYYHYEDEQKENILQAYKKELGAQAKRLVEAAGIYTYESGTFEVDASDEGFGEIKEIHAVISEYAPPETQKPFIRIEPVTVHTGVNTRGEEKPIVETSHISELKKIISDFYNLPTDNIYISIREKSS